MEQKMRLWYLRWSARFMVIVLFLLDSGSLWCHHFPFPRCNKKL